MRDEKKFYESKTVQGLLIAVAGSLLGIWLGDTEISATIITAGLGWAGYGAADKLASLKKGRR